MIIRYTSSLQEKGKGLPGLPQRLDWRFEFAGAERRIPAVYRFSQGIVFDIITPLDEAGLRQYLEKYSPVEAQLTSLQQRRAEQEHPYQGVPIMEIWINGKRVESEWSASSVLFLPWVRKEEAPERVRRAYSAGLGTACFACERVCVPYPEARVGAKGLLRLLRLPEVNSVKLVTWPVQRFTPLDIEFELYNGDQKHVCITHPEKDFEHTLYIQKAEPIKLPVGRGSGRDIHVATASYEIEPPLPPGETLQFRSSIEYAEPPSGRFSPAAAASIGIIGGADGPTAIFMGKKDNGPPNGPHGLPLQKCLSVPAFQEGDPWRFVIEGINATAYKSLAFSYERDKSKRGRSSKMNKGMK